MYNKVQKAEYNFAFYFLLNFMKYEFWINIDFFTVFYWLTPEKAKNKKIEK